MKTITEKQYETLCKMQQKAQSLAWTMKHKDWIDTLSPKAIRLEKYRRQWKSLCRRYGILDYDVARYKVENGKDYSHGYNFGDTLA